MIIIIIINTQKKTCLALSWGSVDLGLTWLDVLANLPPKVGPLKSIFYTSQGAKYTSKNDPKHPKQHRTW